MEYKGYRAYVDYTVYGTREDGRQHGRVMNSDADITFSYPSYQGGTEFQDAVDEYLRSCESKGVVPAEPRFSLAQFLERNEIRVRRVQVEDDYEVWAYEYRIADRPFIPGIYSMGGNKEEELNPYSPYPLTHDLSKAVWHENFPSITALLDDLGPDFEDDPNDSIFEEHMEAYHSARALKAWLGDSLYKEVLEIERQRQAEYQAFLEWNGSNDRRDNNERWGDSQWVLSKKQLTSE